MINVQAFREASQVKRCHLYPYHGSYTVGQHTFDMLTLLLELNPNASRYLIMAVIYHDMSERWTGDMPAHMFRKVKGLAEKWDKLNEEVMTDNFVPSVDLTPEEEKWLHAVDKLELLLWCTDQLKLGNQHISDMAERVRQWIDKMDLPEEARRFVNNYKWERTSDYGR